MITRQRSPFFSFTLWSLSVGANQDHKIQIDGALCIMFLCVKYIFTYQQKQFQVCWHRYPCELLIQTSFVSNLIKIWMLSCGVNGTNLLEFKWNIMERSKISTKYQLSINLLAEKRPYFPKPESWKQELFSN